YFRVEYYVSATRPADRSPIAGFAGASHGQAGFDPFSNPPVPRWQPGQSRCQGLLRCETPRQYVHVVSILKLRSQRPLQSSLVLAGPTVRPEIFRVVRPAPLLGPNRRPRVVQFLQYRTRVYDPAYYGRKIAQSTRGPKYLLERRLLVVVAWDDGFVGLPIPDLASIQQNGWSKYVPDYQYRSAQSSELGLIPNQPIVPSPVQGFLALRSRLGHGLQLVLRRPGADDFVALT